MCRHIVEWYTCQHLVHKYETCAFHSESDHRSSPPTAKVSLEECYLCQSLSTETPNGRLDQLREMQLTVFQLSEFLGLDMTGPLPDFLDSIAQFFARGDHHLFLQPSATTTLDAVQAMDLMDLDELDFDLDQGELGGLENNHPPYPTPPPSPPPPPHGPPTPP